MSCGSSDFIGRLARKLRLPDLNLDQVCLGRFQTYSWPGNVRELQNAIEHAAIISGDGKVKLNHLPPPIASGSNFAPRISARAGFRSLAEMEMEYIQDVLRSTGGIRARAAAILGISQTTLWRKLKNAGGQVPTKDNIED